MSSLAPMVCACGATIVPRLVSGAPRAASSFESCLYQCDCGRGYSNARNEEARTCIVRTPELNIPLEVRGDLERILGDSLNERNVAAKRAKFCFSSSEDAVTWTVFRWLESVRRLDVVARLVGADPPDGPVELLLWGVPTEHNSGLRATLVSVLDQLGEDPLSRSEPDVILAWRDLLIVVEVKYRSTNDIQPDHKHFARYLDRAELFALPVADVTKLGFYELVRNWRFGAELAERTGRRFVLANLGPQRLARLTPQLESTFGQSDERRFAAVTWPELLSAARRTQAVPAWLGDYVVERGLDV